MQTLFFVGEERSVSKPRWNAVSDCLEVSLCLRELLRCHCEFFVEHLKFVLPGTGRAWLMAVGAQARQAAFSGSTNTHSSESSWAKMLQMSFLSEMFAAEKKKNHHFSFLLWDWKHWWSLHFSFSFIFHEAKEVMEEMEKRGYCWDYEKFGFTKCNCLNCSLANCMDKI